MPSDIDREIERLRDEIERHNVLYHVTNQPEISDAEFDALVRKLERLEAEHPDRITPDSPTQRVGSPPASSLDPVAHAVAMLSFSNATDEEGLHEFDRRVRSVLTTDVVQYVCEPKLDGLAVELVYRNGRFIQGSTRGDGRMGEDVTATLRTIRSIPLRLRPLNGQTPSLLDVRGEVFLTKAHFEQINRQRNQEGLSPFANARNLAAGTLRQVDPAVAAARPLSIYCYDVGRTEGLEIKTQEHLLRSLPRYGLPVNPRYQTCIGIDEVIAFYRHAQQVRDELAYEADGIVVKVDSFAQRARLGTASRSPRWAIAGKFPAMTGMTTLQDIDVSVGRGGTLTPVAVLDPVEIQGVTIAKATLHNEREIRRKDLRIGDTVIVERAGDVIPRVVRSFPDLRRGNEREFRMPNACPICGSRVFHAEDEVAHRCVNTSCPARLKQSLLHFVSKGGLDVDGVGPQLISQLVDRGLVSSLGGLFTLRPEDLATLDRIGSRSATKLITSLEHAKHVPLHRLLYALGVPGIGTHLSRVLATHFGSLEALCDATADELAAIREIGPVLAHAVTAYFAEPRNQLALDELLRCGLTITTIPSDRIPQSLEGLRFVFTGSLRSMTRAEAEAAVRERGANAASSVSASTHYVVVGGEPGIKAQQARQLGVPVLTEDAFLSLITGDD